MSFFIVRFQASSRNDIVDLRLIKIFKKIRKRILK